MPEKLTLRDFDSIFALMAASFPPDEYRTYEEQRKLFENPHYTVYGLRDGGTLVAMIVVWEFDDLVFFENFAVDARYRNGGIGGRMLSDIVGQTDKTVCLEVELPETELAKRRIGFYERHGFVVNPYPYVMPALSPKTGPLPLWVMTYGRAVDETTFSHIKDTLYREVYGCGDTAPALVPLP